MPKTKTDKVEKSYQFFLEKERTKSSFTSNDVIQATGWAASTVNTYITKKWDKFLVKNGDKYSVKGVSAFTEDEYTRMMSQKDCLSNEPLKPELPLEVERLVIKAREAALLALDIYNRPATIFRTEGFTVMMVIAWTSLFHAIFQNRGVNYFYMNQDGTPKIVDGDNKAWELSQCLLEFYGDTTNPIKGNLEFFIGLRNKIEHRYVPALDPHVAGECQALLLNFDELLTDNFEDYYALREFLTVPLQTSSLRSIGQTIALRKFQGNQYDELKDYIDTFRSQLSEQIYQDQKFSFRVYLIPKIGNHANSSDIAYEFVKYDPNNPKELEGVIKQIALIREKRVPVANQGKFKPSDVAKLVSEKINRPFNVHNHTQAWKFYKIRKSGETAEDCRTEYCQYDEVHRDYIYTQDWVDFLVLKLSDKDEYNNVITFRG